MSKQNRDEFTEKTKQQIGKRAGWQCSDPSCRRDTIGANSDGTGEINLGIAAHICAAAPGGPRYDPNQTRAQRRSPDNGIWMCELHGKAVDAKDSMYTVELLRKWKAQSQRDSWRRVLYSDVPRGPAAQAPIEGDLSTRLHAAAAADLAVFQRSAKWPSTTVALTLEVEGFDEPLSAGALATALTTLDDLILVAPPGMGKTTTLFQIAEAVLSNKNTSPIVVPLGDWSSDTAGLLESILKRPAFRGILEADLRAAAVRPGVVLLLDGWNELDAAARRRLAVEVARLQAELPHINLLVSTRKQALDVPVNGTRINLLPLTETQQLEIGKALRGDAGVRMVDQAWRTAGVRELVTIPLYLTALLTLPEGAPFPTTKEEVLRRFVAVHEKDMQSVEVLGEVTQGLNQRFLEDLAATAIRATNTTIPESRARKAISETSIALVAEGQIAERPQPTTVLEALVSHHVLMRMGDPAGYSFQHQQFQEWYASHIVERLMLAAVGDAAHRSQLKADILNWPAWEESVLFACERLARGDAMQQEACGSAILAAFEVDPMLAAEMIARSTDAVWVSVSGTIQRLIGRWHTPGKVDRALRFMINSGRPEFLDQVWPLITNENDQVHLKALRAGRGFRTPLLGSDAGRRIAGLSPSIRKSVLQEIAFRGGMDGLDLATAVAKDDPDPEVKAEVVEALTFRLAHRHIADVLRSADEKTFDLVVRKGLVDEAADGHVRKGIEAARERQRKEGMSTHDRLRAIVYAQGNADMSGELTKIIAGMEIDEKKRAHEVHLIYEARNRYPRAVADGVLQRVRTGSTLFNAADDLLLSGGFSLEEETLVEIALSDTGKRDGRAQAAAAVLGPQAVGRMIVAALEAKKRLRDASGKYDGAAVDRYQELQARIAHASGTSLIGAVHARSARAGNEEMADLADLIVQHPNGRDHRGRPFDAAALATIRGLAEDWGTRMLNSGDATRGQMAEIARLAACAPSVSLLGLLKRLLDENLRRYRAFRLEAEAAGWQGPAADEARTPHTHEYQRAFHAINSPETAAMMRDYLRDEHFGRLAALVLAQRWTAANEPSVERYPLRSGVDFSRVAERRAARAGDPTATSEEAEVIFSVIEPFIADEATEDQRKHAIALSIVAARLPHGQRPETIRRLVMAAPRRSRAALLTNLILSGENVDIELIKNGLAEVFEAGKTKRWILQDGYEVMEWLHLLPFANRSAQAFAVIRGLPGDQREVGRLEEMIATLGIAPGDDAEDLLFQLAEADQRLYASHTWRDAAMGRGTLSAGRRVIDLASRGAFDDKGSDRWHMGMQLARLIREYPELRAHVYELLRLQLEGPETPGFGMLAHAVAEAPDAEGILLLTSIEMKRRRYSFISWRTVEKVVTDHVPSESWKGAYDVVPVPAVGLRRDLLAMATDGGPEDVPARSLNQIDRIRDDYGIPDSEPRHPDLASGKSWPIMRPATEE